MQSCIWGLLPRNVPCYRVYTWLRAYVCSITSQVSYSLYNFSLKFDQELVPSLSKYLFLSVCTSELFQDICIVYLVWTLLPYFLSGETNDGVFLCYIVFLLLLFLYRLGLFVVKVVYDTFNFGKRTCTSVKKNFDLVFRPRLSQCANSWFFFCLWRCISFPLTVVFTFVLFTAELELKNIQEDYPEELVLLIKMCIDALATCNLTWESPFFFRNWFLVAEAFLMFNWVSTFDDWYERQFRSKIPLQKNYVLFVRWFWGFFSIALLYFYMFMEI
jgi:hypothetical protein